MSNKRIYPILFLFSIASLIWFMSVIEKYQYLDIEIEESHGKWYVTAIDSKSQASKTSLKVGAEILSIDGENVLSNKSVRRWRTINDANSILILQNDEVKEINFSKFPKLTIYDTSSLIEGIFSLLLSFVLISNVRNSLSARYLSYVFINIGLTFFSLGASIRGDILGKFTIGLCMKLIPIVLLHFIFVFLYEKSNIRINTKIFNWIYGFVAVNSLLEVLYFFDFEFGYRLHDFQATFELAFFSIGVIFDIVFLTIIYNQNKDLNPYVSTLLKSIGIFFTISISPIVFLSFLSKFVFGEVWVSTVYTTWFILIFPISFTYLLLAKKIYDIDLVVRRLILTTTVSIIPSLLMVSMISILFPANLKLDTSLLTFIFTLVILSGTLFSLEYLSSRWERVVFPRRHFLQNSLKKIAKKLSFISSFKELKEMILVDILESLNVSGGAVIFKHNNSTEIISVGAIDDHLIEERLTLSSTEVSDLLLFELTRNQDYASYLVLTQKKTNTQLGNEELQWLNLIISYLSVSLENLFLIRKMSERLEHLASQVPNEETANDIAWFRKLMFELQEKERFRIATDLHDTTMQDLFFLKRKLTALLDKYADDWQDSEQAKSLLDYIDIINMNLRQSCFELHPYLLQELGLVRTIDKLIELEQTTLPFEIEFRYGGIDMIESCDIEMKRHLFRVFQELINNAKKHSNANKVNFNLSASSGKLIVQYRDDGLGFMSDNDTVREIGGSHIGLEQLKSRILSMRGVFEIKSGHGSGMSFSAAIPLKEGMTA
ncbi:ATP-binding protein [Cohnella sp. GbtcB17]|uniref:ATP-binding protein n=1 Tax=Cohnella sp. GbtcB17 TaxID=2824762 RepID=UPI001C30E6CC|nr:ATP-binding protein [Cohnella sp. GbtcB17]